MISPPLMHMLADERKNRLIEAAGEARLARQARRRRPTTAAKPATRRGRTEYGVRRVHRWALRLGRGS